MASLELRGPLPWAQAWASVGGPGGSFGDTGLAAPGDTGGTGPGFMAPSHPTVTVADAQPLTWRPGCVRSPPGEAGEIRACFNPQRQVIHRLLSQSPAGIKAITSSAGWKMAPDGSVLA